MMNKPTIPLTKEMQALLLETPALISLAAAGPSKRKKEEAKQAALKLFHTETFVGPEGLQKKIRQAEPYFEETFDRLDQALPKDPNARNALIRQWIKEIVSHESSLDDAELALWKEILVKFGMYVSRTQENIVEEFFAPITDIFLPEKDGKRWKRLLDFKSKKPLP